MGFSRQEYESGLPCSLLENFPNPGMEPVFLMSPALAGGFFNHWHHHLMSREGAKFLVCREVERGKKWKVTVSVLTYLRSRRFVLLRWGYRWLEEYGDHLEEPLLSTEHQWKLEACCWLFITLYNYVMLEDLPRAEISYCSSHVAWKDWGYLPLSLVNDVAFSACLQIGKKSQSCSPLFAKRLLEIYSRYWLPQNLHTDCIYVLLTPSNLWS